MTFELLDMSNFEDSNEEQKEGTLSPEEIFELRTEIQAALMDKQGAANDEAAFGWIEEHAAHFETYFDSHPDLPMIWQGATEEERNLILDDIIEAELSQDQAA